jgi:hypothetical protein
MTKEPMFARIMAIIAICAVLLIAPICSLIFGPKFGILGMFAAIGVFAACLIATKTYMKRKARTALPLRRVRRLD